MSSRQATLCRVKIIFYYQKFDFLALIFRPISNSKPVSESINHELSFETFFDDERKKMKWRKIRTSNILIGRIFNQ